MTIHQAEQKLVVAEARLWLAEEECKRSAAAEHSRYQIPNDNAEADYASAWRFYESAWAAYEKVWENKNA